MQSGLSFLRSRRDTLGLYWGRKSGKQVFSDTCPADPMGSHKGGYSKKETSATGARIKYQATHTVCSHQAR